MSILKVMRILAKQDRNEEVSRSGVYTNLKTVPKRLVCNETSR